MGIETEDCPFPDVAEALGPFIKTRDEVAAIRRGLQNYLQSQLPTGGVPLASVNLTTATTSQVTSPPAGLTGVRKSYWRALKANNDAQAKYDALRLELEQIKYQKAKGTREGVFSSSSSVNESYISSLRQKERYRKLKAIEHAYDDITSVGGDLTIGSMDDMLKKRIGEFPNPPSTPSSPGGDPEAEAKVMELRKAVISLRRRVDERHAEASTQPVYGVDDITPEAQLAGLQSGLQELTLWMEDQLTIIANADAETEAETPSSPNRNGGLLNADLSTTEIERLYQKYIEARERLIQNVNEPREARPDVSIVDVVSESASRKEIAAPSIKSTSEVVLPYVHSLATAKEHEHAMMLQNACIRRYVVTSEADTERLIRRMADESHLVQSGASQGKDWAVAGEQASKATKEFVRRRIEIGEAAADSAKETLDSVGSLPGSLNRLTDVI